MVAAQQEQLAAEATTSALLQAEVEVLTAKLNFSLQETQVINSCVLVLLLLTCQLSVQDDALSAMPGTHIRLHWMKLKHQYLHLQRLHCNSAL